MLSKCRIVFCCLFLYKIVIFTTLCHRTLNIGHNFGNTELKFCIFSNIRTTVEPPFFENPCVKDKNFLY